MRVDARSRGEKSAAGNVVEEPLDSTIVVIPARGGSKGVPGKNLARVGGQPLVVRAVRAALAAKLVDVVLVSTDDQDVATAAYGAGADVVVRPAALAGDDATSEAALIHALDAFGQLRRHRGRVARIVVLVQCTSPFLTAADIDAVINPVQRGEADSTLTVAPSHGFLWHPDGTGVNHDPAHRPRRQDRRPELLETGAAYAMTVDGLRQHNHRFFGRIQPVPVDPARTVEIDDPHDLARARALAPLLDDGGSRPALADIDAVVLDFDGTQTDDRVVIDADGRETVTVHRGDGLGVAALTRAGMPVLVLSTEKNPVVAARARKLGVPVLHGIDAKGPALARWCTDQGYDLDRTVYVGNDVNDLACFDIVGWPVAVADAHDAVRARARIVTTANGGNGAVREVASWLLGKELSYGPHAPALHR